MNEPTTDDVNSALLRAVAEPVSFVRQIVGDDPWSRSRDILRSVATRRRTAVKACHASAKSWTAARAALWWITAHPDGVVIVTAPTFTQVEHVIFPEIHAAAGGALLAYPAGNLTELKLSPSNYILGLSTDKGVRFQGWHGKILIILDEAPGVRPDIYEAIEGIRAGGDVRVLALGNPTVPSGPFYDAFTSNSRGWNAITISAFDTPNLKGITLEELIRRGDAGEEEFLDDNVRPYLATRRWVWEKYHDWLPDSPLFASRVLGQFPDQAEGALIPLSWLERAREPGIESNEVSVGIDVAGPGEDETVCWARAGDETLAVQGWTIPEPRGLVMNFLAQYRVRLRRINVDEIGVGYYMMQHIKDTYGDIVHGINVGSEPRTRKDPKNKQTDGLGGTEDFANLKAEAYWGLRQRFSAGHVSGLGRAGATAFAQLSGILYEHRPNGQIGIESKEKVVKRGGTSPDYAEACMLAYLEIDDTPAFSQFIQQRLDALKAKQLAAATGTGG